MAEIQTYRVSGNLMGKTYNFNIDAYSKKQAKVIAFRKVYSDVSDSMNNIETYKAVKKFRYKRI